MADPSPSIIINGRKRRHVDSDVSDVTKKLKRDQCGDADGGESGPRITMSPEQLQSVITIKELRELLHYAALGTTLGVTQPSWCRLLRQGKVSGVNVVVVEGLTEGHFNKHYLALAHLRSSYTARVAFGPAPDSLLREIFSGEVTGKKSAPQKLRKLPKAVRTHPVIIKYGIKTRGLTAYVLPEEEMIKRRFPVKGLPEMVDFVCTDSAAAVTDRSPLYGLDCEMCLTEKGRELTKVSLVDAEGKCLMNELVKPNHRILDYCTQFSGITAAMLCPVQTTLEDVQVRLKSLLPEDAVLVGHSLDNDLKALKLIHPHVIDSSLLFVRELGQRFKLKVLAEVVLKKTIQSEDRLGHDPVEDAVATLELAQYFIQEGPLQVVQHHLEELWGISINNQPTNPQPPIKRFADVLQNLGKSVSFLGKRSDYVLHLSSQHWHTSDKEVVSSFRKQSRTSFLTVLSLSSFSSGASPSERSESVLEAGSDLADLRALFVGPLPLATSREDVHKLFRCCGKIQRVKMLKTALRLHAEVRFVLLESAVLALKVLDGIEVQGQTIKVQRPVTEALLDLDPTLEALAEDPLNRRRLYVVKLSDSMAEKIHASTGTNGFESAPSAKRNGDVSGSNASGTSRLTEETLRLALGHFGNLEVTLPSSRKSSRHASVQFESYEAKAAAMRTSEDLRRQRFLVCPALTPPHLMKTMRTPEETSDSQEEDGASMMKLDKRLRKIYNSLPEDTLSVVVFAGCSSDDGPGLCLLEIKR